MEHIQAAPHQQLVQLVQQAVAVAVAVAVVVAVVVVAVVQVEVVQAEDMDTNG